MVILRATTENTNITMQCTFGLAERTSSLTNLVHCPQMRRWFLQWHARPAWPPTNTEEGIVYLQQLTGTPEDFADFLRLAKRA